MRNSRWRLLLVCVVAIVFFFNSLETSAQTLKPFQKGTTSAPLGYYEYLPQGYSPTDSKKWPIMIFLHGVGEVGDGTSQLSIILRTGLPLVLQNGKSLPFVIIMPQANQQWWDPGQVDQMYEYVKTKYNIDQNRFYMTGLSLGGIGTWLYTMAYPQKVAAMVSCAGNSGGHQDLCGMSNIPIWDFHGDADPTVVIQGDIDAINTINNVCKTSPRAKLTVYSGVAHNCWDRTYDGTGINSSAVSKSYDPFNMDIYTWLLQYSKNGTVTPVTINANAGADKSITLPTNTLSLSGSGSSSAGNISTYAWSKISGPAATLSGQNTATVSLSGLVQGSYTFELKITDVAGNTAIDDVIVTVQAPIVTTTNLVAEWSLDNTFNDISGNNINGSAINSPSFTTDHEQGTAALSLNGSNQYVNINTTNLPTGKTPRTISLWAKTNSTATGYRWAFSFGKSVASQAMFIGQNGTTLYGGGFTDDLTVNNFWQTNTWHHLCLTYDGTTANLYADGTLMSSAAKNWNLVLASATIGRQVNGLEYWNGNVDDVRVYNKALSASEVQALAAAAVQPPPTSSIVAEWKLENNATDASGNNINGTLVNGPTFTTDHKEGSSAISLNGSNQYIDFKNPSQLPSGKSPRSMSLWAKTNDISANYRWAAAYGSPFASQAMFIGQNGTTLNGGGFTDDLTVNNFWQTNVWHHLCLTYDGTTARLYADGALISSAAKNWNLVLSKAYIGRQVADTEYWNGTVDDVRIYNKTLSAAEVQALATSSSSSQILSVSPLVGEWNLDNNVSDQSGDGINGTLMNGAWYTTDHKEGSASLVLNGNSQYVDLGKPTILPAGKSARTLSVWAKTSDLSANYRWVASFGSPATSQAMFIGQNGATLYGGGYGDDLTVSNFWSANVWHHLCLTYDGTTARLYADGALVSSAAKNWNLVLASANIGRQVNGSEYWNGAIDDVRIYNKVLSASEVLSIYQSNSAISARTAVAIETTKTDSTEIKPVGGTEQGNNFTIYPNPAQRSISLNINPDVLSEGDAATIIIHDMTGKQVKKVDGLTPDSSPTDIEELTDGIYVATIVVQGKTVNRQRFIKVNR